VLCPGCAHRGVFWLLRRSTSHLGRHRLLHARLPCRRSPRSTLRLHGRLDRRRHGATKAGLSERVVAVLGDSTFFHTGLPALANVAYNRANVLTVILDNRTTAMTGHQGNPGSGRTLQGQAGGVLDFEAGVPRPRHRASWRPSMPTTTMLSSGRSRR